MSHRGDAGAQGALTEQKSKHDDTRSTTLMDLLVAPVTQLCAFASLR